MRINRGKLVAIVGQVGAGKSSLISAMLGHMNKISGQVKLIDSIAYVPQQAWIQNATVRDNITFGKDYSQQRYSEIVKPCCVSHCCSFTIHSLRRARSTRICKYCLVGT